MPHSMPEPPLFGAAPPAFLVILGVLPYVAGRCRTACLNSQIVARLHAALACLNSHCSVLHRHFKCLALLWVLGRHTEVCRVLVEAGAMVSVTDRVSARLFLRVVHRSLPFIAFHCPVPVCCIPLVCVSLPCPCVFQYLFLCVHCLPLQLKFGRVTRQRTSRPRARLSWQRRLDNLGWRENQLPTVPFITAFHWHLNARP